MRASVGKGMGHKAEPTEQLCSVADAHPLPAAHLASRAALSAGLCSAAATLCMPCLVHSALQDPGVWPKNMAWIGGQGFSASPQRLELDGWDCSFTDPHSLLPSSNTASSGEFVITASVSRAGNVLCPPLSCNS